LINFFGELVLIPNVLFPPNKRKDEIICQNCGYKLVKPYPDDQLCLNCGKFLAELYDYISEDVQLKTEPKQFETKTDTLSTKLKGKVKVKPKKVLGINLESNKIELTKGEYIKLLGITSVERTQLYCSNQNYNYLLELTNNLDYIATSILGGDLDKMLLISEEKDEKEKCQFYERHNIIYLVYGKFPDKKGKWILEQMSNHLKESAFFVAYRVKKMDIEESVKYANRVVRGKNIEKLDKFEKYELEKEFKRRTKFILEEYLKLQEIFGDEDLGYVEDNIRIDYLGLSSMSIGVISLLLSGDELNIEFPGEYEDPDEDLEMKESMLTAKIEAIAANTQGNTGAIPRWISVKLGFQKYRFLTFRKYQNDYFLNLLSEGNLGKIEKVEELLDANINPLTETSFSGNLQPFNELKTKIKEDFNKRRKFPPFSFNN